MWETTEAERSQAERRWPCDANQAVSFHSVLELFGKNFQQSADWRSVEGGDECEGASDSKAIIQETLTDLLSEHSRMDRALCGSAL